MADAKLIGGLFHVATDLERIGDHAENFVDSAELRMTKNIAFSEKAERQLQDMTENVLTSLEFAMDMFSKRSPEHMKDIIDLENSVDEQEKKLQKAHIKRMTKGRCTPEAGILFSDAISGLERVADHATNIAFAILKPEAVDVADEEED